MFNNKKNERIVYFISSLDSLNGNMNNRELLIRKIINRWICEGESYQDTKLETNFRIIVKITSYKFDPTIQEKYFPRHIISYHIPLWFLARGKLQTGLLTKKVQIQIPY